LRNHIEMQDEELVKQRELLMAVLKQNEELANTIKALQEHMNLNTDTNKVKGSHQISINNPRVTFHSHVNPEPEYQGVTKKEIQAMIAQQMQITGGGYALSPVQNCEYQYPSIYNLK
jgi:hypothetical protein